MSANDSGTILVVDDEPEIREIVCQTATVFGYDVVEAENGEVACEIVRSRHVDAVVADLMMPRVTGIALLETLRSEGYTMPFVVVTGFPSAETTTQLLRLGAFDVLEKPFSARELGALLKEAVRVGREMALHQPGKSMRTKG